MAVRLFNVRRLLFLFRARRKIEEAAVATEALARQYFGGAAYVRRGIHEERETGEERIVFEVHYCFPDPEDEFDRLAELHDAFMAAWVRAMSRDICSRVILYPIPCEAGHPDRLREQKIEDAAVATEALARPFFGPAAYLVRDIDVDRETGEEETVFEVHYCFDNPDDDFDRLAELHGALTSAFVRATPPAVLSRIVLDAVVTDADYA
ncbi:MAG TPA: hypothetical protein VFS20_05885 [Longimicrobium sp.]|nr:hypothetical protein [Longimicrobium sp.]